MFVGNGIEEIMEAVEFLQVANVFSASGREIIDDGDCLAAVEQRLG